MAIRCMTGTFCMTCPYCKRNIGQMDFKERVRHRAYCAELADGKRGNT